MKTVATILLVLSCLAALGTSAATTDKDASSTLLLRGGGGGGGGGNEVDEEDGVPQGLEEEADERSLLVSSSDTAGQEDPPSFFEEEEYYDFEEQDLDFDDEEVEEDEDEPAFRQSRYLNHHNARYRVSVQWTYTDFDGRVRFSNSGLEPFSTATLRRGQQENIRTPRNRELRFDRDAPLELVSVTNGGETARVRWDMRTLECVDYPYEMTVMDIIVNDSEWKRAEYKQFCWTSKFIAEYQVKVLRITNFSRPNPDPGSAGGGGVGGGRCNRQPGDQCRENRQCCGRRFFCRKVPGRPFSRCRTKP